MTILGIEITSDHGMGAWNFVYAWIGVAVTLFLMPRISARAVRMPDILRKDAIRMTAGFMLVALAFTLRVGPWALWRSMRIADEPEWYQWWVDHAHLWTGPGAILAWVGTAMIVWPVIERTFGRYSGLAVVLSFGAVWLLGVVLVEAFAQLF